MSFDPSESGLQVCSADALGGSEMALCSYGGLIRNPSSQPRSVFGYGYVKLADGRTYATTADAVSFVLNPGGEALWGFIFQLPRGATVDRVFIAASPDSTPVTAVRIGLPVKVDFERTVDLPLDTSPPAPATTDDTSTDGSDTRTDPPAVTGPTIPPEDQPTDADQSTDYVLLRAVTTLPSGQAVLTFDRLSQDTDASGSGSCPTGQISASDMCFKNATTSERKVATAADATLVDLDGGEWNDSTSGWSWSMLDPYLTPRSQKTPKNGHVIGIDYDGDNLATRVDIIS